ncbi:MAG: sugar ABC transporter permease [Candidatus Izemoplasmatales bacterium]|nr:sugar ABC transporter permease [Candidatus Izemoplasmatales bacterium]
MVGEKKWLPYVLLIPWIIGFAVFKAYPFVNSFILSLYEKINPFEQRFAGLGNYLRLFNSDDFFGEPFLNSLKVTAVYVFFTVPAVLTVSLLIAYVLSKKIKGVGIFRTAFYVPTVLGANVAIVLLWRELFQQNGLVNQGLSLLGIDAINWFGTSAGAMTAIIGLRVWQFGSTMLIFLAALKNVPETLYEAATIDGASKLKQFQVITIPMITPVILFNGVMRLVEMFQVFTGPKLITNGGPLQSTRMINMLIYEVAFENRNFNMGSAMSWILFLIIMVFTVLIFRSSKYWVHYSD